MRLIMDGVWTVTKDHLKILEAAESFIRSHNYVPERMIRNKSHVKVNFTEYLRDLVKLQFIQGHSETYRLTPSGYDCLAIAALRRDGLESMGSQIGIGKESDIYLGRFRGMDVAIKIHRLGRSSFNRIEERGLKNEDNWLLANKESAGREATCLTQFAGTAVPRLHGWNRHMVVMELLDDYETLYRVTVEDPATVSGRMLGLLRELWELGYAHGDFNEFNVMVKGSEVRAIDFPQCVERSSPLAGMYLKRDIECVERYFWKKNRFICDYSMFKDVLEEYKIEIEVDYR